MKTSPQEIHNALEQQGYQAGDPLLYMSQGLASDVRADFVFSWLDKQPLGRPCYIVNEHIDGSFKTYRMLLPRPTPMGGEW